MSASNGAARFALLLLIADLWNVNYAGPDALTVIHEVLSLMKVKNEVREPADTMHIHPALPEFFLDGLGAGHPRGERVSNGNLLKLVRHPAGVQFTSK